MKLSTARDFGRLVHFTVGIALTGLIAACGGGGGGGGSGPPPPLIEI